MSAESRPRLSVGIATRNRAGSLLRCLASIALIDDLVSDIHAVQDGSYPLGEEAEDRLLVVHRHNDGQNGGTWHGPGC